MKRRKDKPPVEKKRILSALPLGSVGQDILRIVADSLQGILRIPVDLLLAEPMPQDTFMETRKQYNAMAIIKYLREKHSHDNLKVLGITGKDLCNPILTYVFGEAYMNGPSAVMSYNRLHQGQNDDPVSREHFLDRVVKVALHEIGHTFNLPHCHTGRCVMRASNNLKELDDKLNYLCDYCELFLSESLKTALKPANQEGNGFIF